MSNGNEASTILTLNETWYCPIKCWYCHIRRKASLDNKRELNMENLIKACEKAVELGFNEYRFSGGEPTCVGDRLFEHARKIYEITGNKPSLLTSGYNLSEEWCEKAKNIFTAIYISVEDPIDPYHKVTDPDTILNFIKNFSSKQLPLKLGLTLIKPESYEHIYDTYSYLFKGTGKKCFPQLSSPYIYKYKIPTLNQVKDLCTETKKIFSEYGAIPFYFSEYIGAFPLSRKKIYRHVVNLNPDGTFYPFSSIDEALSQTTLRRKEQLNAREDCKICEWFDFCNPIDEHMKIHYSDLCFIRKSVFEAILEGLEIYGEK